ncbi:MAG: hypothetical protein WBA13_06465 [Microcoleaceae cyanobacterium]
MKLAVNQIKNWIFVTGTIRSGTTFVGTILSLPISVDYIHEPFNPQCGIPGINRWYPYIRSNLDTPEMQEFDRLTQSLFQYNFNLRTKIPDKDNIPRKLIKQMLGSRGPFYLRMAKLNPFHQAAIIKDPIGNLLTEYLYLNFQVKPVIIIKHPLSFIASLKRVNWWPHLGEINDQSALVEDYFATEQDWIYQKRSDKVLAAAAYWRGIHKIFLTQSLRYPDWQLITHEALSQSPIPVFQQLYQQLNLPWSERVEKYIIKQTQGNRSAEAKKGVVQDFKRNSADIFDLRVNSFSKEERRAIFEIVKDIALQFYPIKSFALED